MQIAGTRAEQRQCAASCLRELLNRLRPLAAAAPVGKLAMAESTRTKKRRSEIATSPGWLGYALPSSSLTTLYSSFCALLHFHFCLSTLVGLYLHSSFCRVNFFFYYSTPSLFFASYYTHMLPERKFLTMSSGLEPSASPSAAAIATGTCRRTCKYITRIQRKSLLG